MKNLNITLAFIVFVFANCTKNSVADNPVQPREGIKVQLLSGDNQWDTIGFLLEKPIVLKVTTNKLPLKNAKLKIEQSNCVGMSIMNRTADDEGTISFQWTLNGNPGDQIIKVIALDSLDKAADSLMVHAEGRFFNNAWLLGSCLPTGIVSDLCQSGSGRIFCGRNAMDLPFYSDDNGISWQPLISFPTKSLEISEVIAHGTEIFIGTRYDGVFYSGDNGTTWEKRSNNLTGTYEISGLGITRSGKLFFSSLNKSLQLSSDKGKNWNTITNGIPQGEEFIEMHEDSRGVLYLLSKWGDVYSSTNGGSSWNYESSFHNYRPYSLFIDTNDDLYMGSVFSTAAVQKSTDYGATWSPVYIAPAVAGTSLHIKDFYKVNGTYYFMVAGYGIVRTTNFSSFQTLTNKYGQHFLTSQNGAVLVPAPFSGIWCNQNP